MNKTRLISIMLLVMLTSSCAFAMIVGAPSSGGDYPIIGEDTQANRDARAVGAQVCGPLVLIGVVVGLIGSFVTRGLLRDILSLVAIFCAAIIVLA